MGINICPLGVDSGNLADWAAVVVALLGAAAVGYLAWQANRMTGGAGKEAKRLRAREADLLMVLFEAELALVRMRLETVRVYLSKEGVRYEASQGLREDVYAWASDIRIPEVTTHFHRLHVLPDDFGNGLARLKGALSAFELTTLAGKGMSNDDAVVLAPRITEAVEKMLVICRKLHKEAKGRRQQLVAPE